MPATWRFVAPASAATLGIVLSIGQAQARNAEPKTIAILDVDLLDDRAELAPAPGNR
jgi:hypothetical protein